MDFSFVVATYNMSHAGVTHHPKDIVKDIIRYMGEADVLLVEEASAADRVLAAVADEGFHVYRPDARTGQAGTAIISRKRQHRSGSFPLTGAEHVGEPGAGPSTLKPKWFNVSKFHFFGRPVWIGVIHTTPSVYIDKRYEIAHEQFTDTANAAKRLHGLKIVGGDMNSEPDSSLRNPLEQVGLKSAQQQLGWKDTMDKRCIDDQHYTNGTPYLRAVRSWVREGRSDHRCFFVEYKIAATREWIKNHPKVR